MRKGEAAERLDVCTIRGCLPAWMSFSNSRDASPAGQDTRRACRPEC